MADAPLQPPRAPGLTRRFPTPLPAWALVAVALHIGLFSAFSLVMGSLARFVEQAPGLAFRWGLLSAGVSLVLLLCRLFLERLTAYCSESGKSVPGAWAAFLLVYGSAVFGAAALRSFLAPWILGMPLDTREAWQFVAQIALPLMASLLAIEFYLSRRQARLDWLAVSERLERDLAERRLDLVEIDDRLRREASHHLHGEIQSRLFMAWSLIRLSMAAATREAAIAQRLQAAEHLGVLGEQGLRHARELLGASDSDRPVSARAADLVARFGAVLPVTLDVDPAASPWEARMDPECRRLAILLLEEALLNAFRHGGPCRAHVSLRVDAPLTGPSHVRLMIEDDGTGFEAAEAGNGLGLRALRDDLERTGGRLEVDSRPGSGTRVIVHLPLQDAVAMEHAG